MPTPSTSAWIWQEQYSLYYNSSTKQWAAPQPDGSWKYSSDQAGSTNEEGAGQSGVLEEGEVEGTLVEDIPQDQVWPGEEEDPEETLRRESFASAPLLRLVVKSADPSVLPPEQKIAVLDPAEPVSIGRDRSHERRIRLKELAVSKVHSTLFWTIDEEAENKGYWAIVDNGSTHGTYIKGDGEKKETRLSEPKVASIPARLHHFDILRCGTTSFKVHIHNSFACSACTVSSDSSNIIPLLPTSSTDSTTTKEIPAAYHTKTKEEKEYERREQMKGLRDKFLKPTKSTPSLPPPAPSRPTETSSSKPSFVDRAAARRARDSAADSALKPRKPAALSSPFFSVPGVTSSSTFVAPPSTNIAKADPFSKESKGAQLLSKMGGGAGGGPITSVPSTASTRAPGLGTLIEAKTFDKGGINGVSRDSRPGLGSRPLVAIDQVGQSAGEGSKRDWREDVREASRKRFKEMG
ncbi:hypothetical protein JCM5350_006918 [Sporobolomyces pararoseus]